MLLIPNQVPLLLHPRFGHWTKFSWEPGVANWFAAAIFRIAVREFSDAWVDLDYWRYQWSVLVRGGLSAVNWGFTYRSVGVYATRERLGEPVQGNVVENVVQGWCFIRPFDELLADPVGSEGSQLLRKRKARVAHVLTMRVVQVGSRTGQSRLSQVWCDVPSSKLNHRPSSAAYVGLLRALRR